MSSIPHARNLALGVTAFFVGLFLLSAGVSRLLAGGFYNDSGQMLGSFSTHDIVLADVDADDDLDAITANNTYNLVWINTGSGFFKDSGQSLGVDESRGVAAGRLNGDAAIDVFVANVAADNAVWLNDGTGYFSDTGQTMDPAAASMDVALGDLDGDDDLDAFVANDGPNQVWLNDGTANFSLAQILSGSDTSREVVLGDVDGDDDLDAYIANGSAGFERDELWLNDGAGSFTASGQLLDGNWHEGAALGDLDGDDDLDVYLAAWFGGDAVWLNDGAGAFSDSGQALSTSAGTDVALVDVDGDQDLDAIVAKWAPEVDEIWLNNGDGAFSLSAESLDDSATYEIAAGDLDGDHDDDLLLGNFGPNRVWFRGGFPLPLAWFDIDARINPAGQTIYPWAQPSDALLPILLGFASPQPVDVLARIEAPGDVLTMTLSFAAGQTSGLLSVDNPQPVASETVTVSLSVENDTLASERFGLGSMLVNPVSLIFVDAGQGDPFCTLCFVDWLLKQLGFETSFWMLHHMELSELQGTATWDYYHALFAANTNELGAIVATNPALLWQSFDTLEMWTPAVQAFDEGAGNQVVVSQAMVDEAVDLLEGMQDAAGPGLSGQIENELTALDMPSLIGLTMDEVVARVQQRVAGVIYMPVIRSDLP